MSTEEDDQKVKCVTITNKEEDQEYEINFILYHHSSDPRENSLVMRFDLKKGLILKMYNHISKIKHNLVEEDLAYD
jgi:hypothetical protein